MQWQKGKENKENKEGLSIPEGLPERLEAADGRRQMERTETAEGICIDAGICRERTWKERK